MQQKYLNIIGTGLLIICITGLVYYFTGELQREKEQIHQRERMQYLKDSLQVEESILSIKQLREMENEADTLIIKPHF